MAGLECTIGNNMYKLYNNNQKLMLCMGCIFRVHVSDRECIVPGLYPEETPHAELQYTSLMR